MNETLPEKVNHALPVPRGTAKPSRRKLPEVCECCTLVETQRDRLGRLVQLTVYARVQVSGVNGKRYICHKCQLRTLACEDDVEIAAKVCAFLASMTPQYDITNLGWVPDDRTPGASHVEDAETSSR